LPVSAHGGGTPRLTNAPVGPYHLYAWSDPDPWRVGQVHLELAVTKPNPDRNASQVEIPVTDVEITVTYTPIGHNGSDALPSPTVVRTKPQEFLSAFYYEADPTLTYVGDWTMTVDVVGPDGSGTIDFPMQTLPEHSLNWTLILGAGGVLIVILVLIALWSRSQQPVQPVRRPHRGVRNVKRRSKPVVREEA
jgi:hypothetical protein